MFDVSLSWVAGFVVGLTFLTSGASKLRAPGPFVLAVLEYRVLPARLARLYGRVLPFAEVLRGLALGLDRQGLPVGGVGVFLLICALQDAGAWHGWRPHLQRQTPAWFRQVFGPVGGAVAWGVDLGQGWTTLILFSGYYALVAWAVLSAQPILATAVLGAYGLGRGLPVLTTGLRGRGVHLSVLATSYLTRLPLLYQINALALAVVAGYTLTGR